MPGSRTLARSSLSWRANYAVDSKGRLSWESASKLLGNISDVTREEAKKYLAQNYESAPATATSY